MNYIDKIFLTITKIIGSILKAIYNFVVNFIYSIMEKYNEDKFSCIYGIYGVINVIIFMVFTFNNFFFSNAIKIVHIVIQTPMLFMILNKILRKRRTYNIEYYLTNMRDWSCAATVVFFLNSIFLMEICNVLSIILKYLGYVIIFMTFYFEYRIIVCRRIKSWKKYTLYFFILPFISLAIWSILGVELSQKLNSHIYTSSNLMKYMTIIITVLILNLEIYFTPKEKIDEVRVAVYLILALFSTVGYCFFISDYIAQFLYNRLLPFRAEIISEGINFSREGIKSGIDNIIRWVCLPYLIGSVWGCFTIELANRNINLKEKEDKKKKVIDSD